MVKLNLPPFDYVLKKEDDKVLILDSIRKKYLVLTPEEWVRQHFVHYIVSALHYPKTLIKIEGGLNFNKLQKRSDIVVFDRQAQPWMVIECKAPDCKLSQQTLHQASVYNHTLRAPYLVVTNGMTHICCKIDWKESRTEVVGEMPEFETGQ